jgi:hypothetical protein
VPREPKIRIETDDRIARALLKPGTGTQRELQARANLVRAFYLQEYLKSAPKRASSVFEQKEQTSITDKINRTTGEKVFQTQVRGGEIIITINAPAAEYAESGNPPGPSDKKMRIRVKSSRIKRTRGKRGKIRYTLSGGTKVSKYKGKYYIFANKVKPFYGYDLLRRATRAAFRSLGR